MIAPDLVELWRCPKSGQPLVYFPRGEDDRDPGAAFLLCPASRLRFRVEDDVPVLLVEEAAEVAPAEVDRLVARARQLGLRVP